MSSDEKSLVRLSQEDIGRLKNVVRDHEESHEDDRDLLDRLGCKLCEMLHLNPRTTGTIRIECPPGEAPTVVVERFLTTREVDIIGTTLRQYSIVEDVRHFRVADDDGFVIHEETPTDGNP